MEAKRNSRKAAREHNRAYRRRHRERLRVEAAARAPERNAARRRRYATDPVQREKARRRSKAGRAPRVDPALAARREEVREAVLAEFGPGVTPTRGQLMRIYRERWAERDPERTRKLRQEKVRRRRARRLGALVEEVDRDAVWTRDAGLCGICGEAVDPSDWHLDHMIPLARGGEHSYANVQVSHPFCNRSKCDRLPMEAVA